VTITVLCAPLQRPPPPRPPQKEVQQPRPCPATFRCAQQTMHTSSCSSTHPPARTHARTLTLTALSRMRLRDTRTFWRCSRPSRSSRSPPPPPAGAGHHNTRCKVREAAARASPLPLLQGRGTITLVVNKYEEQACPSCSAFQGRQEVARPWAARSSRARVRWAAGQHASGRHTPQDLKDTPQDLIDTPQDLHTHTQTLAHTHAQGLEHGREQGSGGGGTPTCGGGAALLSRAQRMHVLQRAAQPKGGAVEVAAPHLKGEEMPAHMRARACVRVCVPSLRCFRNCIVCVPSFRNCIVCVPSLRCFRNCMHVRAARGCVRASHPRKQTRVFAGRLQGCYAALQPARRRPNPHPHPDPDPDPHPHPDHDPAARTHLEPNTSCRHQAGSPPPQIASTSFSCCASLLASLLLTKASRGTGAMGTMAAVGGGG